jgi:NADPH-dependent 2,4-dienoyl-CoA reductase/sulfur reductase-like enzyme
MAPERVVIIGAGPAGLAAARGYRDARGDGAVTLIGAEPHLPFTIWYAQAGVSVGVLTHERDEDYERGRELIARGERL